MNTSFRVVTNTGHEYEPIDAATLLEWMHEGRVTEDDSMFFASTGQSVSFDDTFGPSEVACSEPLAVLADGRVNVVVGDLTLIRVDAIVNAANLTLLGGGGIDGAIHDAGGPAILEECKAVRKKYPKGLPTGEAVITTAGRMPASFVIHTVGPVYKRDGIK